jgi:hypothetical protein
MSKKIVILLMLILFVFSTNRVLADCLDFSRVNSWYVEGARTILFFSGIRPIARVNVGNCVVYPDSRIQLTRSYMCDSDRIVIDGNTCTIMTISSASGGSF